MKAKQIFDCIEGHTCGNPVRLVISGKPELKGRTMAEKRLHFLEQYDWIRQGLMFEPRGHDMMSGSFLYSPANPEDDAGILFIETSGCLHMCGHGTIGTVTMMLEKGLLKPRTPGLVRLEVPAGRIEAHYVMEKGKVLSVKIRNVPSFLYMEQISLEVEELGQMKMDVAYGGNFYAIIDPQENYRGIDDFTPYRILKYSPLIREMLNQQFDFIHPGDPRIRGLSHVMWTGKPMHRSSTARNAVFYGDHAIDRSPCGTGTSARMAQWHARGWLGTGDPFVHESIIGSTFTGTIEGTTKVGDREAIVPAIEGWAKVTGESRIIIDEEDDPYACGFQVK